MVSFSSRRLASLAGAVLIAVGFVVAGCGDDPILGPDDGSDDGGGSYGVIKQLAPEDSVGAAPNPEQF
jgi:hypothetical protein